MNIFTRRYSLFFRPIIYFFSIDHLTDFTCLAFIYFLIMLFHSILAISNRTKSSAYASKHMVLLPNIPPSTTFIFFIFSNINSYIYVVFFRFIARYGSILVDFTFVHRPFKFWWVYLVTVKLYARRRNALEMKKKIFFFSSVLLTYLFVFSNTMRIIKLWLFCAIHERSTISLIIISVILLFLVSFR